ncbi:MAG: DUF5698 domain-containing protein [Anaerolineales bacterium]|nr:DUF5698 domain-containing protein [Anaerolineales bacterium]
MDILDLNLGPMVLPFVVFLARFVDVTLGTLRIIFLSRGRKFLAPALGFVEVLIWITVVSQIVGGAQNFGAYFAYAAGFAVGNYFGMLIEEKLAIGTLVVRIILPKNGNTLVTRLREEGFGVTFVDGHGGSGPVVLVYTVVMRRELYRVIEIIEETTPKAFYTVEELRSVRQGIFPLKPQMIRADLFGRKKK